MLLTLFITLWLAVIDYISENIWETSRLWYIYFLFVALILCIIQWILEKLHTIFFLAGSHESYCNFFIFSSSNLPAIFRLRFLRYFAFCCYKIYIFIFSSFMLWYLMLSYYVLTLVRLYHFDFKRWLLGLKLLWYVEIFVLS